MKHARYVTYRLILTSALIYLSTYTFISVFWSETCFRMFNLRPYVVVSNSMSPVLKINDLLIARNCQTADLEEGDIIVFKIDVNADGEEEFVVHYLDEIIPLESGVLTYRTMRYFEDDSLARQDAWVLTESEIIGQYIITVPLVGHLVMFFRSVLGWLVIGVNLVLYGTYRLVYKPQPRPTKWPVTEFSKIENRHRS